MGRVIAITGKGGTGKTALSAMLIRHLVKAGGGERVLAIDADPDANLADSLGVEEVMTVGDMREFLQDSRLTLPPDTDKLALLEAKIFEVLQEEDGYDLLVMGKPEGPGCYCYVNNLLKGIMERTVDQYDLIIMDTPAGLEHFSRGVMPDLDTLIVVTDASRRGLTTGERIQELAKTLNVKYKHLFLVANKVTETNRDKIMENAKSLGLQVIGTIPYDESLAKLDLTGEPLIDLPDDSLAVVEVRERIIKEMGL